MRAWLTELRRRGIFRVAAIYIIGAWAVIQIADIFFPAWGIPDTALKSLLAAAVLGLPVALIFGWFFDIGAGGITRTPPADARTLAHPPPLRTSDYVTLAALLVAAGLILYSVTEAIVESSRETPAPAAVKETAPNSVAVLPFENISADPANDYFCDGVTEEILHSLSDFRDLQVMARASSFAFRDSDLGAERISRILGVQYLLQGSVRKSEDTIRVSASLVDQSGFQVWSETYDRELRGIFTVQTEIAAAVAKKLAGTILQSENDQSGYTPDIEAYQQFLLGREYLRSRVAGYQREAIRHFDRAIEIDPEYAEPYAGKGIALMLSTRFHPEDSEDMTSEARLTIDRALAIDPNLPLALAANGLWLVIATPDDSRLAETELRRALQLDPDVVGAANWLIIAIRQQGRIAEAAEEREKALHRDPLNPILTENQALHYAEAGDFERAEALLLRLLDLPRPPGTGLMSLTTIYGDYGHYVQRLNIAKLLALEYSAGPDGRPRILGFLVGTYGRLGMWAEAEYWQRYVEKATGNDPTVRLRGALLFKLRGDEAGMARLLEDVGAALESNWGDVPSFDREILGAVRILTGDLEGGTLILESVYDQVGSDASYDDLDFMQFLAYAYLQTGKADRAGDVLGTVADVVATARADGGGQSPEVIFIVAQNQALSGDRASALRELRKAIDKGWRNYYFAHDDPRWAEFRGDPRFEDLMAAVLADVEDQRRQVEQLEQDENFPARFEAAAAE